MSAYPISTTLKEDNLKLEQREKRRKQRVIFLSNYLDIDYITLYKGSLKQKRSDRSLILFPYIKKENDIAELKEGAMRFCEVG